jgi:superfamily I DNA and/or RNA helicase
MHNYPRYAQSDDFLLGKFCENLISQTGERTSVGIIVRRAETQKELQNQFIKEATLERRLQIVCIDKLQEVEVETDIVIIACADRPDITYISGLNRINKAMTRAKHGVFIVGRSTLFAHNVSLSFKKILN